MYKRCIIFLFLHFALVNVSAQDWQQNLPKQNPGDKPLTLPDYQKAFNDYWDQYNVKEGYYNENGEKKKAPGWKLFKRWEYYWEQRVDQTTGEFPATNSVDEYEKYIKTQNNLNKTNYNESWTNLGTNSSTGGYAGIGRINCIAFHPTDVNTFWVGSPSGGIWKTTDGGSSWTILNDNETVLGVSDIVIPSDYSVSNTIYIATGDRDGGSMSSLSGGQVADNASIGVLKSTDGGTTWNTTGLTFTTSEKKLVYSLIIHPTDNQILLASTSDGIYKTTDGGDSWSQKYTEKVWRLAFKPGSTSIIYGGSEIPYSDVWFMKSTDTGETWPIDYMVVSGGRRSEICVAPSDPTIVYLLVSNSGGGVLGVYKSTDSGASFSVVNAGSPAGMLGYYTDGSGGSGGQGSYDWCIAVDPSDANAVFIGGITTWKSTDGGSTFTANNNWTLSSTYNISGVPVVHADKHALVYQSSTTLFEGNDGGIYKTTNGGTSWTDLSNGMVISQIYRIGVSQTVSNKTITGLQDNGSKLLNSGSWADVTGGDGMECIVDYSDANYMYATYIQGQIKRSINGSTFPSVYITSNIPGGQPTGAWVTPYVIDPNSSVTLFAGYDKVWKTVDRGDNWTSASQVLSSGDKLRSLAIASSNSNVLYAADRTNMWKTTDGGATNWSSITLPSTSSYVTYIAVHATDPNTLWITYGGYVDGQKVYESTDGGGSWSSIATGLPNLPVMSIVHNKKATDRNVLFVGTDLGVYVKDGTNNWASYSTGLPNVVVTELEIFYASSGADKLIAGTFGRGLWETEIDAALPVELSSFTGEVVGDKINLAWTTATEVNNYGFNIERSPASTGLNWETIGFVEGFGNSNSPKQYSYTDNNAAGSNKFSYRLKQIDNDGQFKYSDIVEVVLFLNVYALFQNYPNPFNPSTNISFALPEPGDITLKIFNPLGEEVAALVKEFTEAGVYTVNFNAENLPSGVYIYTLQSNNFSDSKKLILIK
jgi:photosystem II stability/assembly factor-like uncharacterized protein